MFFDTPVIFYRWYPGYCEKKLDFLQIKTILPQNILGGCIMKLKGRVRQVLDPTTNRYLWSLYPQTREAAILEDVAKYWPMVPCPEHGDRSVHFTVSGEAACCAHRAAAAAYNNAVLVEGEPATILEANKRGVNYYWASPELNPYCGHPRKLTLGGKCAFCAEAKQSNPRTVALRSGAVWYQPRETDPCPQGHVAPRRVANGSCQLCENERKEKLQQARAESAQQINKICPDMIISKENARGLGFKVFRTGEPCRAGHTGWRYVSTGGCLECMGR